MKQEDVINPKTFGRLMDDALSSNPETLELFAMMYVCEKLKDKLTEKIIEILGSDMALGCSYQLRTDEQDLYYKNGGK